jgi:hypothetical protein
MGEYFPAWRLQLQAHAVFLDCFSTQGNIRPLAQLLNPLAPEFSFKF